MIARIHFDKTYWPKAGTLVPSIPHDLNDLWDEYEDQASIFIAEALIDNPPDSRINLQAAEPEIKTYLWSLGGDCITMRESLIVLISESVLDYNQIKSVAQAQDLEQRLANLQKMEDAIDRAKKYLINQLDEFRRMQESS
jgi:hypothetical protein